MPLIMHYKMQIHFRYAHTYIYIHFFSCGQIHVSVSGYTRLSQYDCWNHVNFEAMRSRRRFLQWWGFYEAPVLSCRLSWQKWERLHIHIWVYEIFRATSRNESTRTIPFVLLQLFLNMVHKSHSIALVTRTDNVVVARAKYPQMQRPSGKKRRHGGSSQPLPAEVEWRAFRVSV